MNFFGQPLYALGTGGGGGGGLGITQISGGSGITATPDPITSTGVIAVDASTLADVANNKRKLTNVDWDNIDTLLVDDNLDVTGDIALSLGNVTGIGSQNSDLVSIDTNGQGTTSQVEQVAPRGLSDDWTVTTLSSVRSEALYAENLDLLLTFATGTGIYWSDDGGLTHTLATGAFGGRVYVAYDGVGVFVAVEVSTGAAWSSTDGKAYTALPAPGFGANKMTYYKGYFVASTNVVGQRVAISGDNGVSWILQTLNNAPYNFAQNANVLTSGGGSGFSWSFNGISWFESAGPDCRAICYNPDEEVFVAMTRTGSGDVYISQSGSVWILYAGAFAVTANFMFYASEFKRYYIARDNDVTGKFGLESSRDPVSDPFVTRQLPNATVQTIYYNCGYLPLYDRFYICENAGKFDYSTNSESLVALSDMKCDALSCISINGIRPSGGIYMATSASNIITATDVETSLLAGSTSIGSLSVPANTFEQSSWVLTLGGNIGTANGNDLTIRLFGGPTSTVLLASFVINLTATSGQSFEIESDMSVQALGTTGNARISSNLELTYSDNSGGVSVYRGSRKSLVNQTTFDTTVLNTLHVTAQFSTTNAANTIQTLHAVLMRTY